MKNHLKALVALALLTGGAQLQAYTYAFTNHTNKRIAIKLVYQGFNENPRVRVVEPASNILNARVEFKERNADIAGNKIWFVPDKGKFGYIVNPPAYIVGTDIVDNKTRDAQIAASKKYGWKSFKPELVEGKDYKLALELADVLGEASEVAVKTGLKAGAAYMTGGASAVGEGATEAAKAALAKAQSTSNTLEKVAAAEFGLGKIFTSIGKVAARDLIGDHEFAIIEVPNDKGELEIKVIWQ